MFFLFFLILFQACNTDRKEIYNTLAATECGEKLYAENSFLEHGKLAIFDYHQALCYAKVTNKPVLLMFVAMVSPPSDEVKKTILKDNVIQEYMYDNYIVAALYVDIINSLPPEEILRKNHITGSTINTLGEKNNYLQIELTGTGTQPCFAISDKNGNVISSIMNHIPQKLEFLKWLKKPNGQGILKSDN